MRRQTDHLYVTRLGPREREALAIIEERPGITVAELREVLGVGKSRISQIVSRRDRGRVRFEPPHYRVKAGTP